MSQHGPITAAVLRQAETITRRFEEQAARLETLAAGNRGACRWEDVQTVMGSLDVIREAGKDLWVAIADASTAWQEGQEQPPREWEMYRERFEKAKERLLAAYDGLTRRLGLEPVNVAS